MPINPLTPSWESIAQLRASVGSTDSASVPSNSQADNIALAKAVRQVQENPILLRKLSERVYQLLLEDMKNQQERTRNYGGSF